MADRLESLSGLGDPLEALREQIPWEQFRGLLKGVYERERKSNAARKPFDEVLMFKVLMLQSLYHLSDAQVEYPIRERLEALGLVKRLFNRFDDTLVSQGLEARSGQIIDATIVRAPAQHNSREEHALIKQGEVPEAWSKPKRRQTDVDVRWTQKHGKSHYGYKNRIRVDARHKRVG